MVLTRNTFIFIAPYIYFKSKLLPVTSNTLSGSHVDVTGDRSMLTFDALGISRR